MIKSMIGFLKFVLDLTQEAASAGQLASSISLSTPFPSPRAGVGG